MTRASRKSQGRRCARPRHASAGVAALLLVAACAPADTASVEADPGAPLAGLTSEEEDRFARGRALFRRAFTPEEGLGPFFNQERCVSCHDLPADGGHGAEPVTRVSRFDRVRGCDLLAAHGGDLLRASVVEPLRLQGVRPRGIPPGATEAHEVRPPPLYGLGLVAAVDEDAVRRRADPDDRNGDGISGRAAVTADGALGRFGIKGRHATLASFIESAARGEMGLTTPDHPDEDGLDGLPEGSDPAGDPELDAEGLALLVDYVRFLATPAPRAPADRSAREAIAEGERLFEEIGCAACHVPRWTTGPHPSPALDRETFRLYSDLLLHDMGPELAGVCDADAAPTEWLTMRLVGLAHRTEFLHDGRAENLAAAIRWHGGEAGASREAFERLTSDDREALLAFLRTL